MTYISIQYDTIYFQMKRITLRIKGVLYNKVRVFAENNDMTIVAAIRYILINFFNKQ
jgi:hypothetical protein